MKLLRSYELYKGFQLQYEQERVDKKKKQNFQNEDEMKDEDERAGKAIQPVSAQHLVERKMRTVYMTHITWKSSHRKRKINQKREK